MELMTRKAQWGAASAAGRDGLVGWGVWSPCDRYRYELGRTPAEWSAGYASWMRQTCVFIGLNPSTANEVENDPTVERCMRRAFEYWEFDAFVMLNLFPLVSTDPAGLKSADVMGGRHNLEALWKYAAAGRIVAGWGNHAAEINRPLAWSVQHFLNGFRMREGLEPLQCLSITNQRCPIHPLYVSYETELKDFV